MHSDLPDVRIDDLNTATPLYGEGWDSIRSTYSKSRSLVSKRYGFELRSDNPENEKIFRTLGSLAEHVRRHRTEVVAVDVIDAASPWLPSEPAGLVLASWMFVRSLLPGATPLVARFALAEDPDTAEQPLAQRYLRWLTALGRSPCSPAATSSPSCRWERRAVRLRSATERRWRRRAALSSANGCAPARVRRTLGRTGRVDSGASLRRPARGAEALRVWRGPAPSRCCVRRTPHGRSIVWRDRDMYGRTLQAAAIR